jgi:hypothetical protein
MKNLLIFILIFIGQTAISQNTKNELLIREVDSLVLTHRLVPTGPVPTAFDVNGVYPYVSYCETAHRPEPVKYRFVEVENRFLKLTLCPDLGGKITSIIYKKSGKEVLYVPDVIRPTRILPRFYFVAGGIEVSFPISHSPTQNDRVLYEIEKTPERIYITCGERELRFGMQWSVEYSLGTDDQLVTQRVVFHNPGKNAYPWMSWSNAAIPSASDTRYYFPKGKVLSHSSVIDTIDWESQGPKTENDIREMTGYFWIEKETNAFGAFTPSLGTGLFHVAEKQVAPGMKLWSYGTGADSSWATLSTSENKPYIEIQGGPISDQSIKFELQPDQTREHTEYWIPTDKPMDINSLEVPKVKLRPVQSIPLFSWAKNENVKPWIELMDAFKQKSQVPNSPEIQENRWAPSGMEDLEAAFDWAVLNSTDKQKDTWKFYYGAWLAGRGDSAKAIRILSENNLGIAKTLEAKLLQLSGKNNEAVRVYHSIKERWIQLHPQVIVNRDKALRNQGKETLEEREYWLNLVDALPDEWIIERRVQLLIDKGNLIAAKKLLLSTHFQKVHQTYSRTNLWFQICDLLREPCLPVPDILGEDRLANFGAYREFE